ncbi:hypothetical protein [Candidatus Leptofilum sp.]
MRESSGAIAPLHGLLSDCTRPTRGGGGVIHVLTRTYAGQTTKMRLIRRF